jgi:polyhydroxybutyrate depolymerase
MRMRRVRYAVGITVAVLAVAGAVAYFVLFHLGVHAPERPHLGGALHRGTLHVGSLDREYVSYVPAARSASPGLLLVYHGGRGDPEQIRVETAYEFEELAEQSDFLVVYPRGFEGHWNACQKSRDDAANRRGIDDVGFTRALIEHFRAEYRVSASQVFAVGFSNGGHMAFRLALEMPEELQAVAAIAANLPTDDDSKCAARGVPPSVLIVNGTADRINPYAGGEHSFYGLLRFGTVLSTERTASVFRSETFPREPLRARYPEADEDLDTWVERATWTSAMGSEVSVLTVHGGGHSVPQRRYTFPRIFGRTSSEIDTPELIWEFFARHKQAERGLVQM